MEESLQQLDELLICRLDEARKAVEPCTIVIFGASGDLTARKLVPALYHLYREKQMAEPFRIIGVARREKSSESWREEMLEALQQFSRTKPIDPEVWKPFSANLLYCEGDISDAMTYKKLAEQLGLLDLEPLRHDQGERQLEQNNGIQSRCWFPFQLGHGQIDLVFSKKPFGFRMIRVVEL